MEVCVTGCDLGGSVATVGVDLCIAGCDPTGCVGGAGGDRRLAAQPGEVAVGWNRGEPLAASGGPARIPPFRSVVRWLAPQNDMPIVTAPPV